MATKGEIVKEYLRKYPSIGSRKIADLIMQEVPGLFDSFDHARSIIRYYRGAMGDTARKRILPESYIPRVSVPPGEPENYEPYILSPDAYPMIVGADAHIPYHDQDALEIFIERARDLKAKTVLLLGDWIDFYLLSVFVKDPRARDVAGEIALFRDILTVIRRAVPKAKIIYKYGNHDERFDDYIKRNAPALFSLERVHLDSVLELSDLGVEIVQDKRVIRAGHLNLIHGHEYRFAISNPVNPARGLYLRAKKSALCGHFHQSSVHAEQDIAGKITNCWSVGCLCGLHPQYMPLNKWTHGFAEITMEDDYYNVRNRQIINYRLLQ